MQLLDLSLPTPVENVALDEALLEMAEEASHPFEILRIWESAQTAVIVGRSSQVAHEVNVARCQAQAFPILRRCSGGASVVIGPGCLMYAVVLSYDLRPQLRMVEEAHQFVLSRTASALRRLEVSAALLGTSDLALDDCKISGNSMRSKRQAMLYHGTLLCNFATPMIGTCLQMPPRQPEYRRGRAHDRFVANLGRSTKQVRDALVEEWQPDAKMIDWPKKLTQQLVDERYSQDAWNYRI